MRTPFAKALRKRSLQDSIATKLEENVDSLTVLPQSIAQNRQSRIEEGALEALAERTATLQVSTNECVLLAKQSTNRMIVSTANSGLKFQNRIRN